MSKDTTSASFPIGAAGKRELRRALVRSTDPAATIQEFQQSHSLHSMLSRAFDSTPRHAATDDSGANSVESLDTDSVMTFLSHLGLTQFEIHKRISDAFLKQLEDEIRKARSDKPLLELLKNCWAHATTIPELRPVLWSILKQLGERTPLAVLKALAERHVDGQLKHADIFRPLTPLLKRLCWEADWDTRIPLEPDSEPITYLETVKMTLLYETLQPLIEEYCSNRVLGDAANHPFVATIRERRVLTTQRRALTTTTTTTTTTTASQQLPSSANTTAIGLLRGKAIVPENTLTSGKSVAQLRNLLSDVAGAASVFRPKLLYAILSILLAKHGAQEKVFLAGAEHLHCTLVADILLSAGGSLPKAYHHVLNLARILDDIVQDGTITDDALVKLQNTLTQIFQPNIMVEDEVEKTKKEAASEEAVAVDDCDLPSNAMLRQLNRIISAGLAAMKEADTQNLFRNPVTDKIAPGYSKVIKTPMCISTMEQKVSKNEYKSLLNWESDVKIMFKNCIDYSRGSTRGEQWYRGEAQRQMKVFREEIFKQAKRLYQTEIAKRSAVVQLDNDSRNRKAAEERSAVKPLAPSTRKRKKEKDEYLPSMPALASILLSDPFVVRILLARVLRDLRRDILVGSSLPLAHGVIPSLLQVLHLARWSSHLCATRGKRFFVPDSGLQEAPGETKESPLSVPYTTLRKYLPLLLRLMLEDELDRRMVPGGDLHDAVHASPDLRPPAADVGQWKSSSEHQVVVSLVQSAMVEMCQPGNGSDASLPLTYPKFSTALQNTSANLCSDRVFFLCLIKAILKHKSKLPKESRDVVVACWLTWLRKEGNDQRGSMASAAHECLVSLLNEWSVLGNLLLPRDKLVEFATETVAAVDSSESMHDRKFGSMWDVQEFSPIRCQYERMLKLLPTARATEWKEGMGIASGDDASPPFAKEASSTGDGSVDEHVKA
jgi:hypothetical protein